LNVTAASKANLPPSPPDRVSPDLTLHDLFPGITA
jgi:hypothetical protein